MKIITKEITIYADTGEPSTVEAYSKICDEMLLEAKKEFIKEYGLKDKPLEFGLQCYVERDTKKKYWVCAFSNYYTGLTNWYSNESAKKLFDDCSCDLLAFMWQEGFNLPCDVYEKLKKGER